MAHTSTMDLERPRRAGLVGPAVLIGLGVILLLNNLGMLGWGIWEALLRYWPVLLIAVGIDIIFGRRSTLASALVALLALLAIGLLIGTQGSWRGWEGSAPAATTPLSQGLEGASRAAVEIGAGVGTLSVSAMAEPDGLVAGTVQTAANERIDRSFAVYDGTAFFTLTSAQTRPWSSNSGFSDRRWDLQLNPEVPTRLTISGGVGRTEADLSRLSLMELRIDAGVGEVVVTLPATGRLSAQISVGVGEVTLTIPPGMAARITVNGGLGQTRVLGTYERSGDTYTSPGYATAEHRIDLTIDGGVGNITVQ